jgi:hypothetical protein
VIPSELMRMISSTQARGPSAHARVDAAQGRGAATFQSLLAAAQRGEVTGGEPVTINRGVPLELSPEQLERVGIAVDRAESLGMNSALVLIDGKALTVDVSSRRVMASVDASTIAVTEIDGVLAAPPAGLAEALGLAGHDRATAAGERMLPWRSLTDLEGQSVGTRAAVRNTAS